MEEKIKRLKIEKDGTVGTLYPIKKQ